MRFFVPLPRCLVDVLGDVRAILSDVREIRGRDSDERRSVEVEAGGREVSWRISRG